MAALPHPNAVVGGTAGLGGGTAVVELLDTLGVHITGPQGALIAGGLTTVALLIGRHGVKGLWRLVVNGSGALLVVAAVALVVALPAAAKKPVPHAAASPAVTASWQDGRLTLEGCGFDVAPVTAVWTLPDATTQTWWIGMFGDGCLDSNYILASEAGVWTVSVSQAGVEVATAEVTVG